MTQDTASLPQAGRTLPKNPKANLRIARYTWIAATLGKENPQAIFRAPKADIHAEAHPSLPEQMRERIGENCGRRVLPYRMQDRYGRDRRPRDFKAIILENEILKATFLPELGGRLMSLFYKPAERELLFNNPVLQPANLALRDAWFAGGIEWNIGQFGHAFHTCSSVFAAAIPGMNGGQGLRLYEFERCTGLFWQVDFHLPRGARYLYAFSRVINPAEDASSMYWWTNIAVPEAADVRVLAPAEKAICCDLSSYSSDGKLVYGQMDLPVLPEAGGLDATYAVNLPFANEIYYQAQQSGMPWVAALDGRGTGFVEASTHPISTKKLFCWGMHQGGRHWQEFLSEPGNAYLEIQAGLAPTQVHGATIPARSQWNWVQAFGYLEADAAKIHGKDWTAAWQNVDAALKQDLPERALNETQDICAALADSEPIKILHTGAGWGALELKRRGAPVSPALEFPDSTLGDEQHPWLALLNTGVFPEQSPSANPGEWMIQKEWRELLETPANHHWFALLHLGIMRMECFDEAGAEKAWEESIRARPSAWAWRNLGALEIRRNQPKQAVECYRRAWELAGSEADISFAQEYLAALHAAGDFEGAWAFYTSLPPEMRDADCTRVLAAKIAFERDDLAYVESALEQEYTSLREGARDLTDLWDALQARKGTDTPAPAHIDFRIIE